MKQPNQLTTKMVNGVIEWDLYEFFRAPGIYYYVDGDVKEKYDSGPSMRPDLYGYRLGTEEEVDRIEELRQKKK